MICEKDQCGKIDAFRCGALSSVPSLLSKKEEKKVGKYE